jgi:hypothetical protein
MTRAFRELERVESRVLGALRFVDAGTGADVSGPLTLRALEGRARFIRNLRGLQVLASWSGLPEHEASFADPPAQPAIGTAELPFTVVEPSGRYLPRLVTLALPRDPDPANAGSEGSLFRPVVVPLYPAPGAPIGANWAVLRVTVTDTASGDRLGGALLRALRNDDVLARGLTDGRGEGLLALVGVPMVTFGEEEEAVVVEEINVTVEATFDAASGTRLPAAALRAGARPPLPLVDPEALEAAVDDLPQTALPSAVAARRSRNISIAIVLP